MNLRDPAYLSLPEALRARARVVHDFAAWPADAAGEVIVACRAAGLAVVGVERWQVGTGLPQWRDASDYDHEPDAAWAAFADACAADARAFVERHAADPASLFQISVIREGEARAEAGDATGGGSLWDRLRGLFRR